MRGVAGPIGVGLIAFLVYAAGACRTIYVGDSGELTAAAALLGIPHPSGYPLYVLLGKAWTLLLPVGSIAYRMSLFSAAASAAACAMLYVLCRRMAIGAEASFAAALLFAFVPSHWAEANVQRVYGLNALFVVLAALAVWNWCVRGGTPRLALCFFICSIGACNHTFLAIFAVAAAIFAVAAEPSLIRSPASLAACAGAFAMGLAPYLYLPIRSRANPALDWGDPETPGRFLSVALRRGFWERRWLEGPADLVPIVLDYLRSLVLELFVVGAALAVVGLAIWIRRGGPARLPAVEGGAEGPGDRSRRRRTAWFVLLPLLVMAGNFAALAAHGSRSDIFIWHRYYIPSYAMAALLAAVGLDAALARIPVRARVLALLLPAAMLVAGWRANDRSRYRIAEDFGDLVLASVVPGAHLAAEDDNILFTLIYMHRVEGRRPDVDLILQGVGGAPLPPLRFDPDLDPLYFTHHPNWAIPALSIVPQGVVFRIWRAERHPPEPVVTKLRLDGEDDPLVPKDYLTRNLIGHFHYMLGVTFMDRDWRRARSEFARAASAAPDNDVLFFNLGLIYQMNGLLAEAESSFRRSDAINPRAIASKRLSRASDKIAEVAAERRRLASIEADLQGADPALSRLEVGSAAHHRRLAGLLAERGEDAAARGHELVALERETVAGVQ